MDREVLLEQRLDPAPVQMSNGPAPVQMFNGPAPVQMFNVLSGPPVEELVDSSGMLALQRKMSCILHLCFLTPFSSFDLYIYLYIYNIIYIIYISIMCIYI